MKDLCLILFICSGFLVVGFVLGWLTDKIEDDSV